MNAFSYGIIVIICGLFYITINIFSIHYGLSIIECSSNFVIYPINLSTFITLRTCVLRSKLLTAIVFRAKQFSNLGVTFELR